MIETDSLEYEILAEGVEKSAPASGLSCEIGLRKGGGSAIIMRKQKSLGLNRVHIAIDPYGNIEYKESDASTVRLDYTNAMKNMCMVDMHVEADQLNHEFLFFPLEDVEFFARYADGVPIYNQVKTLVNTYAFVHFDGPHDVASLVAETDFFQTRSVLNSVWVFDDIATYDHDKIEQTCLINKGWTIIRKGERKVSYIKTTV